MGLASCHFLITSTRRNRLLSWENRHVLFLNDLYMDTWIRTRDRLHGSDGPVVDAAYVSRAALDEDIALDTPGAAPCK